MKYLKLLTIICLAVIISGCTSSREYDSASKVEGETESPTIDKFEVGETASDGKLDFTIEGIIYETIVEGEYLERVPEDGNKFIIVDILVENKDTETHTISSMLLFQLSDKEGYEYDYDIITTTNLDKSFKDGEILPGQKKRGEIVYQVPENVEGLEFIFKFDIYGAIAVFELE